MRTRVIAVVAAFSVLFTAGMASAAMDDTDGDTGFTFGYDPTANLFFTGIQAYDEATLDCSLSGTFTATYGDEGEDGETPITDLTDENEDPVTFEEIEDGEGDDSGEEPKEPTPYSADGECAISGVPVGTNGNINHGQFMKLFNQLVDMQGRGCLNRYLAGSSLGKDSGEQATDPGTIQFFSERATCDHGNKDKDEDHPSLAHKNDKSGDDDSADDDESGDDDSGGQGRPDAPGKSDKAKGNKNKDK